MAEKIINPLLDRRRVRLVRVVKTKQWRQSLSDVIDVGESLKEVRDSFWQEVGRRTITYREADTIDRLNRLSLLAERLLGRVALRMQPNQDWIRLSAREAAKLMGFSSPKIGMNAINELLAERILAPRKPGQYFVDPHLLYSGDHIAYYLENCPDVFDSVGTISKPDRP